MLDSLPITVLIIFDNLKQFLLLWLPLFKAKKSTELAKNSMTWPEFVRKLD